MSQFSICKIFYVNVLLFSYITYFRFLQNDKLKCHHISKKKPNEAILPYLQVAKFGTMMKLENYKIYFCLITVMVER